MSAAAPTNSTAKHLNPCSQVIITTCYLLGISANTLALITLCQRSTRPNNPKHRMMLKCLTANDLTAMLGMLVLMYLQLYLPVANSQFFCGVRVIWRVFGLGSGCVTVVMAVERYLAITKPFLYQKVSRMLSISFHLATRYYFSFQPRPPQPLVWFTNWNLSSVKMKRTQRFCKLAKGFSIRRLSSS